MVVCWVLCSTAGCEEWQEVHIHREVWLKSFSRTDAQFQSRHEDWQPGSIFAPALVRQMATCFSIRRWTWSFWVLQGSGKRYDPADLREGCARLLRHPLLLLHCCTPGRWRMPSWHDHHTVASGVLGHTTSSCSSTHSLSALDQSPGGSLVARAAHLGADVETAARHGFGIGSNWSGTMASWRIHHSAIVTDDILLIHMGHTRPAEQAQ